jgi:hypothetical protein
MNIQGNYDWLAEGENKETPVGLGHKKPGKEIRSERPSTSAWYTIAYQIFDF